MIGIKGFHSVDRILSLKVGLGGGSTGQRRTSDHFYFFVTKLQVFDLLSVNIFVNVQDANCLSQLVQRTSCQDK